VLRKEITNLEKYINGILIMVKNVNSEEDTLDSLSLQYSVLNSLSEVIIDSSLSIKKLLDKKMELMKDQTFN
tara:strand:+ start:1445 stop:1660 length:216 start_codon:yes stop_codon:yes gene_type:complete